MEDGVRVRPASLTYLAAGCGFGGSCFPKDVKALIAYGEYHGSPMRLLRSVVDVNLAQPQNMMAMLKKHLPDLRGRKVAILGMAFKPGTDDIRESPSIPVTRELLEEGAVVTAYDPVARHEAQRLFGDQVRFSDDLAEAVADVEAVLVMTRWPHFDALPDLLSRDAPPPLVIDGRRMLPKDALPRYEGIGLGTV
jgi:UDPglucose 6-dehydrogenase